MDPRLLSLYEQELRYFRDSSGEFAKAFPKIANRLGMEGHEIADPYVERLIEATAFLSARVGLKLDAEYPRFTGHLLDVVYPNYLAPTPSMVVACCQPELGEANLAMGPTMPRGSALRARQSAGQGTYCEFRTAHALRLWPFWRLWPMHSIRPVLTLTLARQWTGSGCASNWTSLAPCSISRTCARWMCLPPSSARQAAHWPTVCMASKRRCFNSISRLHATK